MKKNELAQELRACAKDGPSIFNLHWADTAKRLMKIAADSLEAADVALFEYYSQEIATNLTGRNKDEG